MVRTIQCRVRQFIHWWVGELIACLPPSLRMAIRSKGRRLVLVMSDDRVVFEAHQGKRVQHISQLRLTTAPPAELRESANQLVRTQKLRSAPVEISLPHKHVLRREADLPLAAAENLREVLGFEMDRYTPFKANEIYYDFRIECVDPQLKRIKVDLALVPKSTADSAIAIAKSWNFDPVKLGVESASDAPEASFNFLPTLTRQADNRLLPRFSMVLLLIFIGLGAATIYLPLYQKQSAVAEIEAELLEVSTAALEVNKLENKLNKLIQQSQFVVEEKRSRPTGTKLLNEVTKLLPDDTWLLQLSWKNDSISLSGYSKKASALIGSLERSPVLTNVRFNSSVTRDPRFEMDRFNLSASILRQGK